jgi:DinB superfamily
MLVGMDEAKVVASILSQYRAALAMLRQGIELCPEELWRDTRYRNRYWHIAYHTLFYAHLYVCASEAEFRPWEKHRMECRMLGGAVDGIEPYSKGELLEYFEICRAEIEEKLPIVALDRPSGFDWLPFSRLEAHIYNIGHIHQHTGQLGERLRTVCDVGIKWVGRG